MYNFKNKSWPIQPHKILHVMKWIKAQTFLLFLKCYMRVKNMGTGCLLCRLPALAVGNKESQG